MSTAALALSLLLGSAAQDSEEDKVRALFDRLVKAMGEKDADAINRCFHARRLLKELDRQGFGAPAANEEAEERRVKILEGALPRMAGTAGMIGATWDKIRLLNLQIGPHGVEGVANCRMTIGGEKSRMRFWLAKDESGWKVYDFEMTEANLRLSVMLGSLWANMAGNQKAGKVILGGFLAMQKAMVQLKSGEFDEARRTVRKALETKPPGMLLAWLELLDAQISNVLGEHEEAVRGADRALESQKDLHMAHLTKAQAYLDLEDYDKCIEAAKVYLKQSGEDADGWEMIGNAYDKLSKRKEAIEAYRKGAATDDEEHANRVKLGRLLIADGKPAEAATALKEASRNAPVGEGVFEDAAELLAGAGEFAAVLEMARDYGKRMPEETDHVLWEAKALRRLKRYDEAEKVLRAAIEKDKDSSEFDEELIFTLAQAGKDAEAMERIEKIALKVADRMCFLRAFVHVSVGRAGKALEELKAMLEIDASGVDDIEKEPAFENLRKEVDLQILIGRAKVEREYETAAEEKTDEKEWEALLKLAKERVAAAPDHALAHYHQGLALRHLDRAFDAELALKAAVAKAKEKDKVTFRKELGKAFAAQGKIDEAMAVAEEMAKEEGAKLVGLHLKVVVYVIARKSEPALKALEDLLKEEPKWYFAVESDHELEEFRKLEGCQTLLKKAKAKSEE